MNRNVLVLVDDPFWRTKIDQALKSAQASALFVTNPEDLAKAAESDAVQLVVVDLSLKREPFTAITALKAGAKSKRIPVIGYYEQVRKDIKAKAEAAGCDRVLSRPSFSEKLADMVMEFALPGGTRTEPEERELPEE
jgi:CheY-like chemotaxis protein